MASNDILQTLGEIYPEDRVLTRSAELAPYESDGLTAFRAKPFRVVLAESAEEVIETVRACHRFHVPLVARGSGTSLCGGSMPVEGGVMIALNRLNRMLRLDPRQRIAIVEPGMINLSVSQAAAAHGLYYAPDPSSGPVCTIGGNVAFNSGGAHCLKYGMTANHVLGIKAVLPDGQVVEMGGDSLEMVGPDLSGFFCGSEGLFGIALEITLRLLPQPEKFKTVLAAYDTLEKAGDAVSRIVASELLPGALEIMDCLAIEASELAVGAGYPLGAAAALIVELEGPNEEVDAEWPRLEKLIHESGAYELRVAKDEAERALIWKGRKAAFSAAGRLSSDYIVQDGVVPRTRLGEALTRIQKMAKEADLRVANVFHAGDGNLHPLIMYDGRQPGAFDHAENLAGKILRMCVEMGGSITGEHGVGVEKLAYLPDMYAPSDIEFMQQIRAAVDPHEIANRGKMLAASDASSLSMHGPHPLEKQGVIFRE